MTRRSTNVKLVQEKEILQSEPALSSPLIVGIFFIIIKIVIIENFYVAVPPKNIEILNHHSGSKIEVKENEEVEIACKVSNAKPKARIFWYRNNVAFSPGLGE